MRDRHHILRSCLGQTFFLLFGFSGPELYDNVRYCSSSSYTPLDDSACRGTSTISNHWARYWLPLYLARRALSILSLTSPSTGSKATSFVMPEAPIRPPLCFLASLIAQLTANFHIIRNVWEEAGRRNPWGRRRDSLLLCAQ